MELEYNLENQDLVNFNIFHIKNSPLIKKQIILTRFGIAIFYIIVGSILSYLEQRHTSFIVFLVISVIWILFYKKYFISITKKNVVKMLQEDKNKGIIGKQKIIIEDDKLFEINEYSKIEHNKKCLNKILNDEKYYYLYLTSISALIIPKTSFENENKENNFIKMLEQFLE